ncbi:NAD dependent epimerase/dehydratase family protein [Rosistilla ulvae]|uniref:NAD dependent epimerase/dehydratase family protein n=1 Tax=Rosistilla ulvae TaxID=1930277 RepID=A0A517M6T7_9BACT|nr:NAD-dependent epimerase/dehydratase family protein [Rosistilla ulvae]QDS90589.1 NAD dependent epimerase/dehydratase family protein [Rosistilla ulvae]
MEKSKKTALIFGCGYLGKRVALRLQNQDWHVFAVTRNRPTAADLQTAGISPIVADWTRPTTLRNLPQTDRTLVAVGWDRSGGQSQYDVYVGGLRNALQATSPKSNLVYISSTGVYHQNGGTWVDEASPCCPAIGSGGWAHLQAESLLRQKRPGFPSTILRMAGLYGPNRIPRAKEILSGKPLSAPTEGYLNLIHIDDAASAVMAAWQTSPSETKTYVISDGTPVIRRTYYEEIARVLGKPLPSFVSPDSAAPASRRATTSKRIWTARMRRDLCPQLAFPDYRSGLRDVLHSA